MNNLAEVLKAIPRLKARTTFQTASSPAGATPQAPEQAARPAPPELREPPLLPGTMSELPRAAALLRAAALPRAAVAAPAPDRGSSRRPAAGSSRRRAPSLRSTATEGARPPSHLRSAAPPSGERGACFLFKTRPTYLGGVGQNDANISRNSDNV